MSVTSNYSLQWLEQVLCNCCALGSFSQSHPETGQGLHARSPCQESMLGFHARIRTRTGRVDTNPQDTCEHGSQHKSQHVSQHSWHRSQHSQHRILVSQHSILAQILGSPSMSPSVNPSMSPSMSRSMSPSMSPSMSLTRFVYPPC